MYSKASLATGKLKKVARRVCSYLECCWIFTFMPLEINI